jgi:hypothetical protein
MAPAPDLDPLFTSLAYTLCSLGQLRSGFIYRMYLLKTHPDCQQQNTR